MIKYPESFYKSTGSYACYFFCLMKIAEDYTGFQFDINTVIQLCSLHKKSNGVQWLTFNWNDYDDKANFDVNSPTDILNLLTGKNWSCERINSPTYKAKKCEYVIQHYTNPETGYGHFNMKDYDPIQNSITVRDGKIDSYRVFKIIN